MRGIKAEMSIVLKVLVGDKVEVGMMGGSHGDYGLDTCGVGMAVG